MMIDDHTKLGVSVIICTYNGAERLGEAIGHLSRQQLDAEIPWEVIVVDNASTDDSALIAETAWKEERTALKVIREPRQGLSHARRAGIKEAQYEYLSFIDDDNWVDRRWVQTVYEILHTKSDVGVCGGQIEAICETSPPSWFERFSESYAVGKQQETTGFVTDERGYLWGAGLNLKRSVFRFAAQQGFRSFLTGRKGESASAGEDTEICFAYRMTGCKLWYDERLRLKHFIPKTRLTWSNLCKMFRGFGAADLILDMYRRALSSTFRYTNVTHYPAYYAKMITLTFLIWKYRRFVFSSAPFENIPEKIHSEFYLGLFRNLLETGLWKFNRINRNIFALKQRLAT